MNVDKRKTQVEVLAPAGSLDIMKAVVAAGADAIYLGGNMLPIILMMKSLSVLLNMHIYSVERFT